MPVPEEILEVLRCIDCHSPLEAATADLVCTGCGLHFPVVEGIPVMLPESAYRPERE